MIDLTNKGYSKSSSKDPFYKKEYHHTYNTWYKVTRDCELLCNSNKKLQFVVKEVGYIQSEEKHPPNYSIRMIHEYEDGIWCDIQFYSLTYDQITNDIINLEQRLLKMWLAGQ